MDSHTLMLVGTLLIGVVGAVIFFASQPAPTKTRSAQGGLKPRGTRFIATAVQPRSALSQTACAALSRSHLALQKTCTPSERHWHGRATTATLSEGG